jgi:glycosyltransferase involved in cell wall biosynthesis
MSAGLSVIICCHNGAARLPTTLMHLKEQAQPAAPWEVLLIDNASTDGSAEIAHTCWRGGPAPLRVINESRLGVRYARERGIFEARYDFLGFVDDDNWVAHDWVRTAYDIISSDPSLGAVGSIRIPACETSSPPWFDDFHSPYAILTEQDLEQMEKPPDHLPTAGLCVSKAAWDRLTRNGFRFHLTGRAGKELQGGEDTELTMALRLSGWQLRVDPRLRLQHFMPEQRLKWMYLRRLQRGHNASWTLLDAYSKHNLSANPGPKRWISESWWYQLGRSLASLIRNPRALVTALALDAEGSAEVIEVEKLFGRALGLLRLRGQYRVFRRRVREADWLHLRPHC